MREPVAGPPKGFRKAIPDKVKVKVLLRQRCLCAACGQSLEDGNIEYDHIPAIWFREWDKETKDTIPACNDPSFIFAKCEDCHRRKTSGSAATSAGSDIHAIAKTRRLSAQQEEMRRRLLAKSEPKPLEPPKKGKRSWPKRSFRRS